MSDRAQQGLLLKQAREAKGISLESAHEATKIPMDVLKAIEDAYTIRTLSPFYYRGFLKMYAKFLGVELNVILDDYKPEKLPAPIAAPRPVAASLPDFSSYLTAPRLRLAAKIIAGIVIFIFAVKTINFIAHRKPGSANSKTEKSSSNSLRIQVKKEKSADKRKLEAKGSKKAATSKTTAPAEAAVSTALTSTEKDADNRTQEAGKKVVLSVRAKKDSWLQVKADGVEVFRATLKKGTTETWNANERIELSGNDIGGLDFELNGKILGPLSRENRRSKKVIITPAGFSVK
ncbi:MAG TPA: DUF4115 domain-containing protein [Candidatus Omnitrophota bacterium]|nr:DUF4115 domain-containing protein [Candidatus Omnitrophota bacterium]HPD85069.1 DUF4115 domain-containing protein [Candidatus Omnitrophota bacterium]HRZ03927.1 DUF4115 domain-containing protein [Candidatus Omnitrophota bacterium]